ncbi:MAG TPA: DivIVA domain-containing protein [Armatimonadota bacterium]|nr:DivIVA domain-containing protein [Armatimonadota bacterium]HOS42359.1 DivIVA domain-containing protein [Armatimonadota bacterium]
MAELTPNDIVNKQFRHTLRGYAQDEVDEFLQQAAEALYQALEDALRLRQQLSELRARLEQYEGTENLIKSALVMAERTAEDVRTAAHREAELIRREAEERTREERAATEELRQLRLRVMSELHAMLTAHLNLLESQASRFAPAPPPAPETRAEGGTRHDV